MYLTILAVTLHVIFRVDGVILAPLIIADILWEIVKHSKQKTWRNWEW